MAATPSFTATRRAVDEVALQRAADRLARVGEAPWLHGEVARRMGERLAIVKLQPTCVLDWRAGSGGSAAVLAQAYPRARRVAVEPKVVAAAPPAWWSARRWLAQGSEVQGEADVEAGAAQLVWANMMLHTMVDPMTALRAWQRALAVDGFLMFSTLGPGSAPELRALYAAEGWGPPMAPLVDMHDLGDMLVEAGFADPVMDQELVTLTWRDADAALAELRSIGANADPARTAGLRTPRWRQRLVQGLERLAAGATSGRVELTLELVYGHAFKPVPRIPVAPESTVTVEALRTMARAGRDPR